MATWRQGGLELVLSRYILDELVRVLPRLPRVQMSASEIRDLADHFLFFAEIVDPAGARDDRLRDPTDQPILQTLLVSSANYLVTGDKDLLALADRHSILTPAQFWQRHGS